MEEGNAQEGFYMVNGKDVLLPTKYSMVLLFSENPVAFLQPLHIRRKVPLFHDSFHPFKPPNILIYIWKVPPTVSP